jgi:ABC-type multidrug transport system ATPase subunit
MTVRETFEFYYDLRRSLDQNEKEKREKKRDVISELISRLKLERVENTVIGDLTNRGISGGERKRVSIGVELVKNPYLLFVDEPTTGLDSANAFNVVSVLRNAKESSVTIVSTIHQPSNQILQLFDQIVILADGEVVYSDSP